MDSSNRIVCQRLPRRSAQDSDPGTAQARKCLPGNRPTSASGQRRRQRHEVTSLLYARPRPQTPEHPTNHRAARPLSARAGAVIGFAVLGDVISRSASISKKQPRSRRGCLLPWLGRSPSFPMSPVHALEIQAPDCEMGGGSWRVRDAKQRVASDLRPKSSTSLIVLGGE
jgi:hypothetical protein